jgi:hypothetical protein
MPLNGPASEVKAEPVEGMCVPVNYADLMILMESKCQFHTNPPTTDDDNFHEVLLG